MGHTRYSGCAAEDERMDVFALDFSGKVFEMPGSDWFDDIQGQDKVDPDAGEQSLDTDLLMEQILENMNATPIGQVLKKIAALPQVRKEKVLDVRRQLTEGQYDLNGRLDVALEKVLEDLGK